MNVRIRFGNRQGRSKLVIWVKEIKEV